MYKRVRHIMFFVLLHLCVIAFAQEEEEYSLTDSVVTEVPTVPLYQSEASSFVPISKQAPVEVRAVPREQVDVLKTDEAYWYANVEPEPQEKKEEASPAAQSKPLFAQEWFRNFLWVVILCSFIAVVLWYLASSNIRLFRREAPGIAGADEEEPFSEDIFGIEYEKEIRKAAAESNYRLAVRLWYLSVLKDLSQRNLIHYSHEKTNSDYLHQLWGGKYYRGFFRLTRNFEYTWYGQFDLSPQAYEMMRADFSTFKRELR